MPAALFGITDDTVNLVVNLLVLFLFVVWFALIAWTYLDARRRIDDPVLVMCATGASIFPYVGTIVYSILRPPELLADRHERELEIRASELRLRHLEEQSCPRCQHPIERTYLRCPSCRVRIKHPCDSCQQPVDPRWSVCPHCETALRPAEPKQRPARAPREQAPKPKRQAKPKRQPAGGRERPARKASPSPASGGAKEETQDRPKQQAPSKRTAAAQQGQGGTRSSGSSRSRSQR